MSSIPNRAVRTTATGSRRNGVHRNLIAGAWEDGDSVVRNINPSDTNDIIGEYVQADERQVAEACAAASASIPVWKIALALAYGCTVVFKPANLVPGCAHALAEIFYEAGLDGGEFNLVMGRGSSIGDGIANEKEIAGVSFTGSTEVGHGVAQACVRRNARVQPEMGGKNPIVVLDDADLEQAVEAATIGAFSQTGQRYTASSRIIVTSGVHDRFIDMLIRRLGELKIDSALRQDTDIGPAVDERQYRQHLDYIEIGKSEAKLAYGGTALQRSTPGFCVEPALFVETTNDVRINREEMFGPIASVIRASDYDEALEIANDTPYAPTPAIRTQDARRMADFRGRAGVGMVMCNTPTAGLDYHVPFGGGGGEGVQLWDP